MTAGQSLLDLISIQMGCTYLSDLKLLTDTQRALLAHKLEPLTPREEDLDQWNDVLVYLANVPPETSAHGAKTHLIQHLLHPSGRQRESTK